MGVMDGIQIGHAKCAYPPCTNDPIDHRARRFCESHDHYHGLCGVYGCDRIRTDVKPGNPKVEACDDELHQAMWYARVRRQGKAHDIGYAKLMSESKKGARATTRQRGDSPTMWVAGVVHNIQLLVAACGCPVAWDKFVSTCDLQHSSDQQGRSRY